jgi:hypothetical protein
MIGSVISYAPLQGALPVNGLQLATSAVNAQKVAQKFGSVNDTTRTIAPSISATIF